MIRIFYRTIKEKDLKEIDDFKTGSWIHMVRPNKEEVERVVGSTGLNHDLLKDALDPYEGPRLENYQDITYVFTRVPFQDGKQISTHPLLIAIGKDYITTVARENIPLFDQFIQDKIQFSTTQRIKFFVQLFSEMNQQYSSLLVDISKRVRSSLVTLEQVQNKDIVQFVYYENVINDFLSALIPTNTLLHTLLSGRHLKLFKGDVDLVEDMFLSTNQLIEICRSTLKNIVNIRDAYSTIMTQDTNKIVKLLTLITILLTVPTMISSFFGMNLQVPLADSPVGFHMVVMTAFIVVILLLIVFVKRRWF